MTRNECLEILELPASASDDDIVNVYRQLAQVWHPDRFPNNAELQQKANAKLAKINQAYKCLRDKKFTPEPKSPNESPVDEWYYTVDGVKAGSAKGSELIELAASGTLKPDDLVWKEGFSNWIPARQIKQLRKAFPTEKASTADAEGLFVGFPRNSESQSHRNLSRKRFDGLVIASSLFVAALIFCAAALFLATPRHHQLNEPLVPQNRQLVANEIQNPAAADREQGEQPVDQNQVPADTAVEEVVDQHNMLPDAENTEQQPANNAVLNGADETVWRNFQHPKGVARIDMPGEVELNRDNSIVPPPPGVIQTSVRPPADMNLDHPTTYTAASRDFVCSLKVSKLNHADLRQIASNPKAIENIAKFWGDLEKHTLSEGPTKEPDARILSYTPLKLGAAHGREFQIETDRNIVVSRMYITSTHMCWATIVLPKTRETVAERDRFFGSLRFNGTASEIAQVNGGTNPNAAATAQGQGVSQPRPFIPGVTRKPQKEPLVQPIQEVKNAEMGEKENNDAIPEKIIEYFRRAEAIRLSRIKSLEAQIEELRFAVVNARAELKPQKKKELSFTEKALTELRNFKKPTAPLPSPLEIGDIGYYEVLFHVSIWDDTIITALTFNPQEQSQVINFKYGPEPQDVSMHDSNVIIKGVDAKLISKIRPDSFSRRMWSSKVLLRVVASAPDEEMLRMFPDRERDRMKARVVLEPIKKPADIERFRDLFYERKPIEKAATP